MPLFISDDEFSRHSDDVSYVAAKADEFIRNLQVQLDTVKAAADAASITAEQTCSLLEQKFLSLSSDFSSLESQNAQLQSSLDDRLSDLAEVQAQKHQLHLQAIGKDGEIERLTLEVSEVHKSKRQLVELMEQKDLENSEKGSTISNYLDRIVNLTDSAAHKESRISEIEAELARTQANCARLSQEKELIERHNAWLNEELTAKVDSLIKLRRAHADLDEEMSIKLVDAERRYDECSSSLKWNKERVNELEVKLTSLQEEFCSYKDAGAANEEQFTAEIATTNKLVELYKERSEEWSRKAGELEGVVKALETQMNQLETGYKERLEKEISARNQYEKEAADLKLKLERCEADVEASRKANELNLLPLSSLTIERSRDPYDSTDHIEENNMLVPRIPVGVSGTALATSLLRDGWSLAKMYAKYQEAVDALRHEQLGRREAEAILQRVLYELEEKAGMILDERAEYDRMVESHSIINQKLQNSISEQANLEKTIEELKVDLRRHERENNLAQKEIADLQKQVTILLKECRDIQLRCGSIANNELDYFTTMATDEMNVESDAEKVISERLLTFKDINGLVEQNVQLRSLVRDLSNQIENKEMEFKEKLETELKKQTDEATCKVTAVLQRAEEQSQMIESLHTSVAMYKRLYEEEHKLHSSPSRSSNALPDDGRKDLLLLLEGSKESGKLAQEKTAEQLRSLEEELQKSRSDIVSLQSERDKLALEIKFTRERLDSYRAKNEQQEIEINSLRARNAEFPKLLLEFQRKVQESSEALNASGELSRKLNMEVSVLKYEKDILSNAEKRACDEVRSLSERVYRLQASLDTIHSAEDVREEARAAERRKQEEHIKQIEREWAEAKKELERERNNVRALMADREGTLKDAMRQVEEMGKELTKALHAVSAAESRAAAAEAKLSELEKKVTTSNAKVASVDDGGMPSSFSTTEAVTDLLMAKDEIEKLKEEAQANKDHMLQYKSIAQVNEAALKQMEVAHENFKMESEKMKESLEDQLRSLRDRILELENELKLKSEELASATAGKENALASAMMEIASLKDESSSKISKIMALENQVSALKEDLEKEHQRWRSAQDNYERQVVLQSETIKELAKTSEALASVQQQASDLRKLADEQKSENKELHAKFEAEKLFLEESKKEAEKKYNELNEQNKILHNRLEALHIQLAEKDRTAAGISSSFTDPDSQSETGLQNVISYLRRTKEIAETEISLLKQEKLRLQSQLEKSLKAAESAQASLHTERANSRASLFSDEEFKSLKFQVGEINLLRESNMQLREENRHNFEEGQKLREEVQKARAHSDNLESLLRERQIEIESFKKKIEMEIMEKDHLEKRVSEVLERSRNIDLEDYDRMKDSFREMQEKLKEKESEIEEVKNLVIKNQETISKLEQDLSKSELELSQREQKVNDILKSEASLTSELKEQRKLVFQMKRKFDNLSKEKDEFSREKQALSKQIEDLKQGKRTMGSVGGEQVMKEREEKEHKIQLLERHVEKLREDLKKEKEDHRLEKANRKNREKAILESFQRVEQDKSKYTSKLDEHKEALKRLSDELEKLKHLEGKLPQGTSVVQLLSGNGLDDVATAYLSAVDNFEKTASSVSGDLGATASVETSVPDASATNVAGQSGSSQSTIPSSVAPTTSHSTVKADTKERRPPIAKSNIETRKTGRRLVRPRLVKPDEPQVDAEMSEVDASSVPGKLAPSHESATQRSLAIMPQPPARKRLPLSSVESTEQALTQGETSSDVGAPVQKRPKVSDSPNEGDGQSVAPESLMVTETEETVDALGDFTKSSNEDSATEKEDVTEKEDMETIDEKVEPPKESDQLDDQVEPQNEKNDASEQLLDKPGGPGTESDGGLRYQAVDDSQEPKMEIESEKEDGEVATDVVEADEGVDVSNMIGSPEIGEGQAEGGITPVASPARIDDEAGVSTETELGEINFADVNDEGDGAEEAAEGSDKLNEGDDQIGAETEQITEATTIIAESGVTTTSTEADTSKQTTEAEESKQASPASQTSTVVNLVERARQRAMLRQYGATVFSSPDNTGRGRAVRGRVVRTVRGARGGSGRTGRGGSPSQQG
ncbi:nuclear-pore anchor isoform X2 [Euphorbia lathyris]|uniref:nuclear-pore anchor isoform X2 n=1 Tax=Euphorbia lathyris TaxID=212925 RepID=UPI0033134383